MAPSQKLPKSGGGGEGGEGPVAPNQNYPRDGKPLGISLAPPEGVGGQYRGLNK